MSMEHGLQTDVQCLSWQDISNYVHNVNPVLANIIDELSPDTHHRLYQVNYPFGSTVLQKGQFFLPDAHGILRALNDPNTDKVMRADLTTNPVSLVLNKSFELFLALPDKIIALHDLITAGTLFNTWHIVSSNAQPNVLWNITAGARSIFMLPKISEELSHQRLRKELGVTLDKPQKLAQHWHIFRQIHQHCAPNYHWHSKLLYFSKQWFQHTRDAAWQKFHAYLLESTWSNNTYMRNQYICHLICSIIHNKKQTQPKSHILDTVQHILNIAIGQAPGFAPAIDESQAPIALLQDVYSNIYGLKHYAPVILQPQLYQSNHPTSVYYSLNFPTTMLPAANTTNKTSSIAELFTVRSLLDTYLIELGNSNSLFTTTPYYLIPQQTLFSFFHSHAENYTHIYNNHLLAEHDSHLTKTVTNTGRTFPHKSPFVRSCIRLDSKTIAQTHQAR